MNLYKVAERLEKKNLKKLAQKVVDLAKRLEQKKRQEELAKETKESLRLEDILRQHEKDKPYLRFPEEGAQTFLPEEPSKPYKGRWEVHLQYPSFDNEGAPYFDSSSVSDFVTVSEDQLKDLEKEERMGYLKILSKRFLLPKSKLK